jgi:putative endonuclease
VAGDRSADVRADPRRALGAAGEAAVARWYAAAGYAVLDRNWRCRDGELDLVVARDGALVFCEVKTRRSTAFGTPAEAVTVGKQQRLRALAMRWLDAHPDARRRGAAVTLRFDVASVLAPRDAPPVIDVIESAF